MKPFAATNPRACIRDTRGITRVFCVCSATSSRPRLQRAEVGKAYKTYKWEMQPKLYETHYLTKTAFNQYYHNGSRTQRLIVQFYLSVIFISILRDVVLMESGLRLAL